MFYCCSCKGEIWSSRMIIKSISLPYAYIYTSLVIILRPKFFQKLHYYLVLFKIIIYAWYCLFLSNVYIIILWININLAFGGSFLSGYLHGYSILSPTIVLQRDQIYKISSSRVSMSMPPRFNTIIRRRRRSRRRSRSFEQKDIIITLSRAQWQLLMMMIKSKFRGKILILKT